MKILKGEISILCFLFKPVCCFCNVFVFLSVTLVRSKVSFSVKFGRIPESVLRLVIYPLRLPGLSA
jgi:hypothetical protein